MREPIRLNVGMNQLDALLLTAEQNHEGHRGLWFCFPDDLPPGGLVIGDVVHFTRFFSEVVAAGVVTEVGIVPEDHPKYCSRVNTVGFRWREDASVREFLAGLAGAR